MNLCPNGFNRRLFRVEPETESWYNNFKIRFRETERSEKVGKAALYEPLFKKRPVSIG